MIRQTCPLYESVPLEISSTFDYFDRKTMFLMQDNHYTNNQMLNLFRWDSPIHFDSSEQLYTSYKKNQNVTAQCGYMNSPVDPSSSDFRNVDDTKIERIFMKRKLSKGTSKQVLFILLTDTDSRITQLESVGNSIYKQLSDSTDIYYIYQRGVTRYSTIHFPSFDSELVTTVTKKRLNYYSEYIHTHINTIFPRISIDNAAYDLYRALLYVGNKDIYILASGFGTLWAKSFLHLYSKISPKSIHLKGVILNDIPFYFDPYNPDNINTIIETNVKVYINRYKETKVSKDTLLKNPSKYLSSLLAKWSQSHCPLYISDVEANKRNSTYRSTYFYTYRNSGEEQEIKLTIIQLKRFLIYLYSNDLYRSYFFPAISRLWRCGSQDRLVITSLVRTLYKNFSFLPNYYQLYSPLLGITIASYIHSALESTIYKQSIQTDMFQKEVEYIYRYLTTLSYYIPISSLLNTSLSSLPPTLLLTSDLCPTASSSYLLMTLTVKQYDEPIVTKYKYVDRDPFESRPCDSCTYHYSPIYKRGMSITCGEQDLLSFIREDKLFYRSTCTQKQDSISFDGSSASKGTPLNTIQFANYFITLICLLEFIVISLLCLYPNCYCLARLIRRIKRHRYRLLQTEPN
ncbi:hypothetical protein WA158_005595 [Blastocystis sp. Blastoise]